MARLGIFGGSFDPPHVGHLILAEAACEDLQLDSALWMPSPDPPHKHRADLTAYSIRRRMVEAAIAGNARFALCEIECERPAPYYTVDTVRILQDRFPDAQMWLLIGEDSLHDLPQWYRPDELIAMIPLLTMKRPHAETGLAALERRLPGVTENTTFLHAPLVDVSSTKVRALVHAGASSRYLIPEAVARIIIEEGLYR